MLEQKCRTVARAEEEAEEEVLPADTQGGHPLTMAAEAGEASEGAAVVTMEAATTVAAVVASIQVIMRAIMVAAAEAAIMRNTSTGEGRLANGSPLDLEARQ